MLYNDESACNGECRLLGVRTLKFELRTMANVLLLGVEKTIM